MKQRIIFFLWCLLFLTSRLSYAQQAPVSHLKAYTSALSNIRELKPIEKLYLQTDKPYYNTGDTLRFKAYLLKADYLVPSEMSGLLYVELDNEQGKSAKRIMVPIEVGLAWGDIALDTAEIPDGNYTLRAYTNWMRNFGEDYIFKKSIRIARYIDNPLLVKAAFKRDGNKLEAKLLFNQMDGRQLAFKDVELKVMSGRKNLSKDKLITGPDGSVSFNFNMPEDAGNLGLQATIAGNSMLNIPVAINRKENTDLQFMPEGGQLVAGISSRVGFKAIGEDGKGVDVSGKLFDSKGKQVTAFASAHGGMGIVEFTPAASETYSAKIDGISKVYVLPAVKPAGIVLAVGQRGSDSLQIAISSTPDVKGMLYLIAQARGVVCYAQSFNAANKNINIAKKLFPTGIVRFSLLNDAYQPLNERVVFINHHDALKISVTPDKLSYGARDSVALHIEVKNKNGDPVNANFSLAVTDAGQVEQDSLGGNILNNLLLTSDLKGNIEEPGFYFTGYKDAELDNLMLTQGWVGYDWQETFKPKLPFTFKAEKEFTVSGTVVNAFGKPIQKSNVLLISNRPVAFKDTITDSEGRFVFKDMFPVDTAIFKLQARNKNNKAFNVGITMDEATPPVFGPSRQIDPWYLNIDSLLLKNTQSKLAESKAISSFRGDGNVLKEVNINSKRIVRGSRNVNGPGAADFIISEEEIDKKPVKTTLEQLLVEKFPGFMPMGGMWSFRFPGGSKTVPLSYVWKLKKVRFIFDGIPIDRFFTPTGPGSDSRYQNIKSVVDYFTAEDIVGIEVMENTKYSGSYHTEYAGMDAEYMQIPPDCYVYIEVTTRAKQGPFMKATPGAALYKPLPFSIAKQFYSPRYTVRNKNTALGTDLRSTIFWEPNVFTDKEGKATVHFYSADRATKYNITIEGTDLEGQLGLGTQQLVIKQQP